MKRLFLKVIFLLYLFNYSIFPEQFKINYSDLDKYELKFFGDYSVYLNGKYQGLNVRNIKGVLNVNKFSDNLKIEGNVYYLKKTIRGNSTTGFEIDKFESCSFILTVDGQIKNSSNITFPPLLGVPFFPDDDLSVGDIFENYGKATVTFFDREDVELLEIKAATQYKGKKEYRGKLFDYFEISYRYVRVLEGDNIKSARGQHNLSLYFDNYSGKPYYMLDRFEEEFELRNGDKIKHKGFYNYFYKLIIPMQKDELMVELKKDTDRDLLKDLDFKKKKEGISITINNLKFKPDSTELLETEWTKLKKILNMLSKIEDRSFLIVGHTALAGTEKARMKLSLERAKTIADFLINNGIKGDRILFTGKGATEPVAPNDTEENMQKNRRVEIIILED